MKKKIDEHGVHLHGCECRECMKSNVTCPKCGRKYWTEPTDPQFECSRCMHIWDEGQPVEFQKAADHVKAIFNKVADNGLRLTGRGCMRPVEPMVICD